MASYSRPSYEWFLWILCPNDGSCNSAPLCTPCQRALSNEVNVSRLPMDAFFSKYLVRMYSLQEWFRNPDSLHQRLGLSSPLLSPPSIVYVPATNLVHQGAYSMRGSYHNMGVSNAPPSLSSGMSITNTLPGEVGPSSAVHTPAPATVPASRPRLSEETKDLIRLYHTHGLSYQAIAIKCGCSKSSVCRVLHIPMNT
ncbi:MAG: hypothetical protein J3Q66DRAFT_153696 [Benniella sp.]|nr:MAG: hypothetical protein J3Q66DRAFT_153696 [Benniella sp.]